jgi:protein-disulfide isomerase
MNLRSAAAFAVVLAVAAGAVGYAVATRNAAPNRGEIVAIVKEILAATPAAPTMATAPASTAVATAPAASPMAAAPAPDSGGMTPMASTPAPTGPQTAELSDDQQHQVEATIRNYLIANPEIVRDAIDEMQRKEDAATQVAQVTTIKDNAATLFDSKREVVLGNPKGDVTLVEFFDYNCAYCRRAHADMLTLLKDDPNLRVVLKEFPILGDGSVAAAQIAVAVLLTAPDKYAAFHDELITDKGEVDGNKALAVAADIGLDPKALKAKANSDEVKANITEVSDLAQKLNLTGTPSYATKLKVVVGAVGLDALKAEIKAVRDCTQVASC